eukprot:CAMPEP_0182456436 /NCGR_PEP_ID=MMETSP1319-20130603/2268_1 /TAXON_ID=172717 /ORGANISM="Bolidomonas pacifica, Strain RCC208" /LENGTH=181 /DNA_ID=CAMNT_0024654671 /DNA_START=57 /DNA_END=602 /DNA_ORIENTATION=-
MAASPPPPPFVSPSTYASFRKVQRRCTFSTLFGFGFGFCYCTLKGLNPAVAVRAGGMAGATAMVGYAAERVYRGKYGEKEWAGTEGAAKASRAALASGDYLAALRSWYLPRHGSVKSHAVGGVVAGSVMAPLIQSTMRVLPGGALAGAAAGAAVGVAEHEFKEWVEEQRILREAEIDSGRP